MPFVERFVGDYRQRLLTLLAAVALVLLIACGNVANLLLARGAARVREIAVRTALGAGQWRVVRQLLTESLVLALAAAAGLVIARGCIAAVVAWSTGFEPSGVLSARVTLPATSYTEPERIVETLRRIDEAAAAVPGVSSAAITSYAAMGGGGGSNGLVPEGKEPNAVNMIESTLRVITPGFFTTMGVPIVKGRNFTGDRADGEGVMIVSAGLAALAFPGQDPIGKTGDPASLVRPLNVAVTRVDRDLPLFDVRTMERRLAGALATARFNMMLLTLLGIIGLVLAATGIFGVIAYSVSQRTQEIGVRIALGATAASVVRLVLGQALRPVAIGAAVGVVAALAETRVLASQLFGVSRTDPLTIAVAVATLIGMALVAGAVPARRAAVLDPTRALQAE